jgi:hypothetical protein
MTSQSLQVLSGERQSSILAPQFSSVYVNDLPDCISTSSPLAMFAMFKCILITLRCYINAIASWCSEWQMDLNNSKCGLRRITRNPEPVQYSYNVQGTPIKFIDNQKDLSVIVNSKDLKWTLKKHQQ